MAKTIVLILLGVLIGIAAGMALGLNAAKVVYAHSANKTPPCLSSTDE